MTNHRSRHATLSSELASEEMMRVQEEREQQRHQQQLWKDYCNGGLALSNQGRIYEEVQHSLNASAESAMAAVDFVLEFDVNQQQDDLRSERVGTAAVQKDVNEYLRVKAPPRPLRRSHLSFEEETFDLKQELSLIAANPEHFDAVEQGFESLLLEVVDAATTEGSESSYLDSSSDVSDLALDETDLTYLPISSHHLQGRHNFIDNWLSGVEQSPGGNLSEDTMNADPQVYDTLSLSSLVNSPVFIHGHDLGWESPRAPRRHPTRLSDIIEEGMRNPQSQQRGSPIVGPMPSHLDFDNQSQPDLQPKYSLFALPKEYWSSPTDRINANINSPRYYAAQVAHVLGPVPDIAEQMNLIGLGISYDEPEDPILSAPRAPLAMRFESEDSILSNAPRAPLAMPGSTSSHPHSRCAGG